MIKIINYMSKKAIVTLVIILSGGLVFGQEEPALKIPKNEFGLQAGATTGFGFSYRHWFNKFGLQTTAFYGKETDVFGSAGLTFMYSVRESNYSRFYFYCAHSYLYAKEGQSENDDFYDDDLYEINSYNIGIGPGFSFGRVIRFNLMFGYGLYDVTDNFYVFPTGEIGLYYCF
jgi:hypothetical protein